MTSRDFCYWLQGAFEVHPQGVLSKEQTDTIKRHLALVFQHEIDPKAGPKEHQDKLNETHGGSAVPVLPGGPIYRC